MPFTKPANEKIMLEMRRNKKITDGCVKGGTAKKTETRRTKMPIMTPRTMPPPTNPAMSTHGGVGETKISSIERAKNLDWKNVVATFEKELVTTASITRPGTMNCM